MSYTLANLGQTTCPNPAIGKLQTALKRKGFDPGPIDCDYGRKTNTALSAWLFTLPRTVLTDPSAALMRLGLEAFEAPLVHISIMSWQTANPAEIDPFLSAARQTKAFKTGEEETWFGKYKWLLAGGAGLAVVIATASALRRRT